MSEIRKFESWAIRDSLEWKESYGETISWSAFKRYASYMTWKATKYGKGNFKKWIPDESYEDSIMRHYQKYMDNKYEEWNIEIEEDHLSAILFNVFWIMHNQEMEKKRQKNTLPEYFDFVTTKLWEKNL